MVAQHTPMHATTPLAIPLLGNCAHNDATFGTCASSLNQSTNVHDMFQESSGCTAGHLLKRGLLAPPIVCQ